ncbi:helix-turn-helix transcriptional regulator [Acidiferrimicrobium sp. IK]|uniref:helix-turn-helix transcriptional regulator n=1 Tax=Acidiferrimicrobium sp. IK TaxID=2871700 RepID=UPI0021CB0E50|nr:helix-turn-helix transcriptional regulator [Acidiferrimicrobium sp. IK]MCU4186581.1 helix-turn-helix transcriptional regulator [Acidiferrimicrobium sp. IK]
MAIGANSVLDDTRFDAPGSGAPGDAPAPGASGDAPEPAASGDAAEPAAPGDGPLVDPDALRRRELGAFLRSRRERIAPDQVGLSRSGRRRTPGLRREEVAALAGVGVTWYTWLEQGRDIRVSGEVLSAICRTLQFDPHERRHLFALAGSTESGPDRECTGVTPAIEIMLRQLVPLPACVLNGRFDILAYNRPYAVLCGDLDRVPYEDRNTLLLSLTYPEWRRAIVDWDDAVARCVGQLRGSMADHVAEPAWKALVRRLSDESPEFAQMWAQRDVHQVENRVKLLLNPDVGLLRLDFTNLWAGPRVGTRLVTYTPADAETEQRLRRLVELRS